VLRRTSRSAGGDVGGLLRYLYGPGRENEHIDPHQVASWDDAPATLEPPVTAHGVVVTTSAR
jgi:hypothetical protein